MSHWPSFDGASWYAGLSEGCSGSTEAALPSEPEGKPTLPSQATAASSPRAAVEAQKLDLLQGFLMDLASNGVPSEESTVSGLLDSGAL